VTLRIEGFDGIHHAYSIEDLKELLMKRGRDESNSFWLSHENKKSPSLALLVKGELAGLHYFPEESHPGFVPLGNIANLSSGNTTTFYTDKSGEEINILNDAVVPLSTALLVAREFFSTDTLPKSIKWMEL
jgi:hypothetical protein